MDEQVEIPGVIEPTDWFVVFHRDAVNKWFSFIAFGRFKHVSAFAYVAGFRAWVFYDAEWSGLRLRFMTQAQAEAVFREYVERGSVVKMTRTHRSIGLLNRFGFYCVPTVKHLLGHRGVSLTPDQLYRSLIRNGGVEQGAGQTAGRPDVASRATESADGPC